MKLNLRKLEVKDLREVERFITENVESLEAGLEIIDTCVLLGHARVDLVGLDARGSLVLTTLGFSGNDEMLLRMLDAYSWCLDYPDTLRRLYPRAQIQPEISSRVRVMFVAESLPDEFLRKVKYFTFPEVVCFKFLHFDINGETAVYFDPVERIRQAPAAAPVAADAAPADAQARRHAAPVQHPVIEGTPPVAPVSDNGGAAAGTEPGAPNWQDFLKDLGTTDERIETPRSEASVSAPPVGDGPDVPGRSSTPPAAEADRQRPAKLEPVMESTEAAPVAGATATPVTEPGAGDAPATLVAEDDGALSREWSEFLNNLKASG